MRGKAEPIRVRFWRCVDKTAGCWLWTGGLSGPMRYGAISENGRRYQAHRVSWEIHNGPIPPGLWVLHKCDNPRCVNPAHLFLGTRADNMRDAYRKGRTNLQRYDNILPRGEGHHKAKLTVEQVRVIRSRRAAGETTTALAAEYGVSSGTISNTCNRRFWREVD